MTAQKYLIKSPASLPEEENTEQQSNSPGRSIGGRGDVNVGDNHKQTRHVPSRLPPPDRPRLTPHTGLMP